MSRKHGRMFGDGDGGTSSSWSGPLRTTIIVTVVMKEKSVNSFWAKISQAISLFSRENYCN
eukprot:Awhi_evm1s11190